VPAGGGTKKKRTGSSRGGGRPVNHQMSSHNRETRYRATDRSVPMSLRQEIALKGRPGKEKRHVCKARKDGLRGADTRFIFSRPGLHGLGTLIEGRCQKKESSYLGLDPKRGEPKAA